MSEKPLVKPLIAHILEFIRTPEILANSSEKDTRSIGRKLWIVLQIVAFGIVLATVTSLFISGLLENFLHFNSNDNNSVNDLINRIPAVVSFILIVLVGPFTEELGFRLFLKPDLTRFFLGFGFCSFFWLQIMIHLLIPDSKEEIKWFLISFGITFSLCFLTLFLFRDKKWRQVFYPYSRAIVYLSIISFALIHIDNYKNLQPIFWLIPLLVIPQYIVGWLISYIRLQFGFIYGFLAHAGYNFLISLQLFFLLFGPSQVAKLAKISSSEDIKLALNKLNSAESLYYYTSQIAYFFTLLSIFWIFTKLVLEFVTYIRRIKKLKSI